MNLAKENIRPAEDVMQMPFRRFLTWNVRLIKRAREIEEELRRRQTGRPGLRRVI